MRKLFYLGYYILLFVFWFLVAFSILDIFMGVTVKNLPDWIYSLLNDYGQLINNNIKWFRLVDVDNFEDSFMSFFYKNWSDLLILIIALLIFYYSIVFNKYKNIFKKFAFGIIYVIWMFLFWWIKFGYFLGKVILSYIFKKRNISSFWINVLSVIIWYSIVFGLTYFLSKLKWWNILLLIFWLNYFILFFYFIPNRKKFDFKEMFLLKFLDLEDIKLFFRKFWIGAVVIWISIIVMFIQMINIIVYLDIFLAYLDSIVLYFGKIEILSFAVIVALWGVLVFLTLERLLHNKWKIIVVALIVLFLLQISFMYYISTKYYENNFPWRYYSYLSFYNLKSFLLDWKLVDLEGFIDCNETCQNERQVIFDYIREKKDIDLQYYYDSFALKPTGFICWDFEICSLNLFVKPYIFPLNVYEKFKIDFEKVLKSKNNYSYYDMLSLLNGLYGIKLADDLKNMDYTYIVLSNIENKKFIPMWLLHLIDLIMCRNYPIYNFNYIDFKKVKILYDKIWLNAFPSLCVYKYAYLWGYEDITSEIEYKFYEEIKDEVSFEEFQNLDEEKLKIKKIYGEIGSFVRLKKYLTDKNINGIVKGKVKIIDGSGTKLIYWNDYEIVIQPVLDRFYQNVGIYEDLHLERNKSIVINLKDVNNDGYFYLTWLLVPLKFWIWIRFYDEWKDYKFIKWKLGIFKLSKNKPEIDIWEVIIQVFKNVEPIEKIVPKKWYFYIVYLDRNKIKAIPKKFLELKNGKLCRNLDRDVIDCGYYLLENVDYIFDFDNWRYWPGRGNVVFGKWKIFAWEEEIQWKYLKDKDYGKYFIQQYFDFSYK